MRKDLFTLDTLAGFFLAMALTAGAADDLGGAVVFVLGSVVCLLLDRDRWPAKPLSRAAAMNALREAAEQVQRTLGDQGYQVREIRFRFDGGEPDISEQSDQKQESDQ